jgi:hypothetical protein
MLKDEIDKKNKEKDKKIDASPPSQHAKYVI